MMNLRGRQSGDRPLQRLRLHQAHGVGEPPKRAVEFHVLIDTGDRAGGHGAPGAQASMQAALRHVFLHAVKDR